MDHSSLRDAVLMEGVNANKNVFPFYDTADAFFVKAFSHAEIAVISLLGGHVLLIDNFLFSDKGMGFIRLVALAVP